MKFSREVWYGPDIRRNDAMKRWPNVADILQLFEEKRLVTYYVNKTSHSIVGPVNSCNWIEDAKRNRWMNRAMMNVV